MATKASYVIKIRNKNPNQARVEFENTNGVRHAITGWIDREGAIALAMDLNKVRSS